MIGHGADLPPVLLTFVKRSGSLPDMRIDFAGTVLWYTNKNGTFVAANV
jgi:hypothetical protein